MEYIADHPGANKLEVQDGVGLGWGTTLYNLAILEEEGKLQMRSDRGHVRLFEAGMPAEQVRFYCGMLNAHSEQIVAQIDEHGNTQAMQIAKQLGLSQKVIRRTLIHMHGHGILERQGVRRVIYRLPRQAKEFLKTHWQRRRAETEAPGESKPKALPDRESRTTTVQR